MGGYDGNRRGLPLGRYVAARARHRLASISLACIAACQGAEERVPDDWMLGVFSNTGPGLAAGVYVERYYVEDDQSVRVEGYILGEDTVHLREWRPGSRPGEIEVYPASDEEFAVDIAAFIVTRENNCGPHSVASEDAMGNLIGTGFWHRGAICVKENPCDDCTENPLPYENYWCDAEPPACEEEPE